jgi:MFS family permease
MKFHSSRSVMGAIMAGHFISAFAALGMPPFFAHILTTSLQADAAYLAGWLYVLPILCTAVSSPWWGKLADRFGKKPLLLRAQLGLAASFLLAGFAPNVWVFIAALALQGLLGGTFAASNAYLATVASGAALARGLTLMQWSARAALVIAPAALGWWMTQVESPLVVYRYLALLPAVAALLTWRLAASPAAPSRAPAQASQLRAMEAAAPQVYLLQFAFVFATVMTFPYFIPYAQSGGAASPFVGGLLFGIPHLVYLLCAVPLGRRLGNGAQLPVLAAAFVLLALALCGQALSSAPQSLGAWRVLMGLAMSAGFVGLHGLIAACIHSRNAGASFGWFESSAKWGAVAAGALAGYVVQQMDARAPFLAGAAVMFIAGAAIAVFLYRRRLAGSTCLEKV